MTESELYADPPCLESELILLRPVMAEDVDELLRCYADPYAAPLFNADNCNGDDFCYTTKERMAEAIAFWKRSEQEKQFIRWAVVDQSLSEVVGTVEMFGMSNGTASEREGILRIDLQSRFETRAFLYAIITLCLRHFYEGFGVARILTKAPPQAMERLAALDAAGFTPTLPGGFSRPFYYERKQQGV